ncbi:twin-arginine translocase TatA/TatE family subunit [Halobaculum sp. WSA2]|uniref:Twin-arginine translocase TatA/TatE family subunit n=1 Tax=Halobaculum saliterrae TaxID=2073113 RepID=A0A6B0SUW6_9EURY|nr:twin-arginine translocase TatA/TatE family subunit [Halobaculum saliterrae]MXR41416.1 twin-arginine translocase TatA/TatE family subunit [Halobaculum saliterrae]
MPTTLPLFGAIPGGPEMLIILLVLVLLFGANKIPKLARSTGQAMGEFKKGREQVEDELQQMQEGEGDGDGEAELAADSTVETTGDTTDTTDSTVETDAEKN